MKSQLLCAALAAIAIVGSEIPADAAFGSWVDGAQARARLISAGVRDGKLVAGVEIDLPDGWKTYWRTPGDAGIAPTLDFAGSTNFDDATVAFPLPHRFDDGYAVTNIYEGEIIFPVSATVPDPAAATDIRLSLDIGVCEEVCLPEHFDLDLSVAPGEDDAVAAAELADARALVPGPATPGVAKVEAAKRVGGSDAKPEFEVVAALAEPDKATVFVEGPADWYAGVPRLVGEDNGRATFRITFDRLGAETPIAGAKLRVTIAAGDKAVEETVPLDAGS